MRMDKANKDVGLKAGQHIGFTAKKNIGLNADADIRMKAAAKLMAEAEGTAMVKSGGSFDIDAGGAFTLKAPSGELSFSGNLTIKSSQINVDSPMINLGKGGTPAIILSTQFLGIGNLGMPVISQAIGGFSSSVFIGS